MAPQTILKLTFLFVFVNSSKAFAPYTVKDHTLVSNTYTAIISKDWLGCVLACSQDPVCLSYNYQYEKEYSGLCELNGCGMDRKTAVDGKALMFTRGHLFQQLKPLMVSLTLTKHQNTRRSATLIITNDDNSVYLK